MKSIAIGAHLLREDVEPEAVAVPVSGLYLSALEVEDDQALSDRDLLLKVAAIRSRLLDRAVFIAIRYGFAFRSAAEAEGKCAVHAASWIALLRQHRSHVELTLKVAAQQVAERPDRHAFSSGAEYLRALHATRSAARIDESFRRAVDESLGALCVEQRWLMRDASSLEMAGLIERERLGAVFAAGAALKKDHPDVPFLLSAPWPLEVFADADHE